jgi:hypothetical protein
VTDNELTILVRNTVHEIETSEPQITAAQGVPACVQRLLDAGIQRNVWVGAKGMTQRQIVEWYAGQVIDIILSKAWFAVNSLINALDTFVPPPPPETEKGCDAT